MHKVLPHQQTRMEASRWIDLQVLLEAEEMESLLAAATELFPSNRFYRVGVILPEGEGIFSAQDFSQTYTHYIQELKSGNRENSAQALFSSAWSVAEDALYSIDLGNQQELIRAEKPVIQLQGLKIFFSPESGNFYPMSKGLDFISWGLQLSYPQLYWDPVRQEGRKVDQSEDFPNSALFKFVQKWLRDHTIPTPFVFEGTKKNIPARLGKKCLVWINEHPDIKRKGLHIQQ